MLEMLKNMEALKEAHITYAPFIILKLNWDQITFSLKEGKKLKA